MLKARPLETTQPSATLAQSLLGPETQSCPGARTLKDSPPSPPPAGRKLLQLAQQVAELQQGHEEKVLGAHQRRTASQAEALGQRAHVQEIARRQRVRPRATLSLGSIHPLTWQRAAPLWCSSGRPLFTGSAQPAASAQSLLEKVKDRLQAQQHPALPPAAPLFPVKCARALAPCALRLCLRPRAAAALQRWRQAEGCARASSLSRKGDDAIPLFCHASRQPRRPFRQRKAAEYKKTSFHSGIPIPEPPAPPVIYRRAFLSSGDPPLLLNAFLDRSALCIRLYPDSAWSLKG